jgi:hypothetical protein
VSCTNASYAGCRVSSGSTVTGYTTDGSVKNAADGVTSIRNSPAVSVAAATPTGALRFTSPEADRVESHIAAGGTVTSGVVPERSSRPPSPVGTGLRPPTCQGIDTRASPAAAVASATTRKNSKPVRRASATRSTPGSTCR